MARRHLIVRGKVQGVGFRWFVGETARRADLAGWVQNRPDGAVEIAVEGDDESVDILERAVHRGPPGARVDGVDRVPEQDDSLTKPFAVRK